MILKDWGSFTLTIEVEDENMHVFMSWYNSECYELAGLRSAAQVIADAFDASKEIDVTIHVIGGGGAIDIAYEMGQELEAIRAYARRFKVYSPYLCSAGIQYIDYVLDAQPCVTYGAHGQSSNDKLSLADDRYYTRQQVSLLERFEDSLDYAWIGVVANPRCFPEAIRLGGTVHYLYDFSTGYIIRTTLLKNFKLQEELVEFDQAYNKYRLSVNCAKQNEKPDYDKLDGLLEEADLEWWDAANILWAVYYCNDGQLDEALLAQLAPFAQYFAKQDPESNTVVVRTEFGERLVRSYFVWRSRQKNRGRQVVQFHETAAVRLFIAKVASICGERHLL